MAAPQAASFDLSTSFLGVPQTEAYGLVRGAGDLVMQQQLTDGTRISFYLQGRGPWKGLARLWINNAQVTLPSANVHFHQGFEGEIGNGLAAVSTGGDQHVDSFFALLPSALDPVTFSGYAWTAVKVAPDPSAPSADLTFLADFQAKMVRMFDNSGVQTAFDWTQNWSWIIADYLIRKFILREGRANQPLLAAELARFDWQSFSDSAAYFDAVLSGGQARFSDGGAVYVNDGDTADNVIEQMLMLCRSYLLESNGKFVLRADQPRASVFTFRASNILPGSFKAYKTSLRSAQNELQPTFRDSNIADGSTDDATRFAIASDPMLDHEAHQRAIGVRGPGLSIVPIVKATQYDLGVNTPERVWRILKGMLVRQLGDDVDENTEYNAPWTFGLTGFEDAAAVEPGDMVLIDPSISEEYGGKVFEVLQKTEAADGTCPITGLEYEVNAYPDVAPPQQALQAPDPGAGLSLLLAASSVANPDFESGDRGWIKEAGFSIVNDPANAYGGNWAAKFQGSSPAAIRNSVLMAAQPGDVILATAMIKRTAGDGLPSIRVSWLNAALVEIFDSVGNAIVSSSFGTSRVSATAPSGAVWGRVEVHVASMTISTTVYIDEFTGGIVQKDLGEINDGDSRFARTAVHSSYRPLTNPLSAHDSGSSDTLMIANFTMRAGDIDISVTGGTIGSLLRGTLYWCFYDDPDLAGGAVTLQVATLREAALQGAYRFFVGSIVTPATGTPDTVGNNDGGTGAQIGSHISRFATVTFGAFFGTHTNPGAAMDGSWGTEESYDSTPTANPNNSLGLAGFGATFDNFFPRNITLLIKGECAATLSSNAGAARTITAAIQYSVNGGTTWTTVRSSLGTGPSAHATLSAQVDSITLPDGTPASGVKIQAIVFNGGSGGLGSNIDGQGFVGIYEASYTCDT